MILRHLFRGLILVFLLSSLSLSASNYYTGTGIISPNYASGEPVKGGAVTDTTTGSTMERISDISTLIPHPPSDAMIVYSRYTPINTSGEYILVHGTNSTSCWIVRLSDNAVITKLERDGGHDIGEVNEIRWDYTGSHPNRVYFVYGMKFYQMDVLTENGIPTLIHDFSIDYPSGHHILNDVEGDSSHDSRYWAWQVVGPYDGAYFPRIAIITYDKQTDQILGSIEPGDITPTQNPSHWTDHLPTPNMVEISPDGDYLMVNSTRSYPGSRTEDWDGTAFDSPWVFSLDGTPQRRVSWDETHSGWAYDHDGNQVFVSQNSSTDEIDACNVETGTYPGNCMAIQDFGFYEPDYAYTNNHFSTSYNRANDGWVLWSTYKGSNDNWRFNQIMMLEIAPKSTAKVWRVTPSYNLADTYRDEGSAALSYDGNTVVWTGNWNDPTNGHGEVMKVDLPDGWAETLHTAVIAPKNLIIQ